MAFAQLGNYSFRIAPSQVFFTYDVDSVVIPTVGGRVVQVYGTTVGDLTVQGLFGQERSGSKRDSWQLAHEFQEVIARMVQAQSKIPTNLQMQGRDRTPMHPPIRFLFNDDSPERRAAKLPIHNWDFMVYVKSLKDVNAQDWTIEHVTGKYSYGYTLTLFIVSDNSGKLRNVMIDNFIARLATGVGWKRTAYNGPMDKAELEAYLAANSPDGTIHGLVLKQFQESSEGGYYGAGTAKDPVAGGAATANQAQQKVGDAGSTTTPGGQVIPGTSFSDGIGGGGRF